MSVLSDIENALGLFDLEQMGNDVIDEVFRSEDAVTTEDKNRTNYYRAGVFLGGRTTLENDTEANFTQAGKLLLIDAIMKRLHNIRARISGEK